ncbi:putative conjugal transfer protein [compost metagenome]
MQTTRTISMLDLLRSTLRWRPDRIIVGEVRGKEANALLKAWNTGHPGGVASIHANDARSGLLRVEQCVQEGVAVVNPVVIAEAVDVLVVIKKGEVSGKRVVEQVAQVERYDSVTNEYIISDVV